MALLAPFVYDPAKHHQLLAQAAQVHADCILIDGTLATFLPDRETGRVDVEKLVKYWGVWGAEVEMGRRAIILQLSARIDGEDEVAGVVSLYMPETETGPFRSEAHKLLVSPRHRKQGSARQLMGKLEELASERHRGMIILGTTAGSGADVVYPRLGYIEYGRLPKNGIHPLTGELVDEVLYYKDVREH